MFVIYALCLYYSEQNKMLILSLIWHTLRKVCRQHWLRLFEAEPLYSNLPLPRIGGLEPKFNVILTQASAKNAASRLLLSRDSRLHCSHNSLRLSGLQYEFLTAIIIVPVWSLHHGLVLPRVGMKFDCTSLASKYIPRLAPTVRITSIWWSIKGLLEQRA